MIALPMFSPSVASALCAMVRPEGGRASSGHPLSLQPGATSSRRRVVRRSATAVFGRLACSGAVLLHSVVPVACGPPSDLLT
jgi:hypothetical protein